MLSFCLSVESRQRVKTWGLQKQEKKNQCFYQTVAFAKVKNQDL